MKKYLFAGIMLIVSSSANAASTACLKPVMHGILHRLTHSIGAIKITSTCGGRHARHSFHYKGMAVDFRPMHASVKHTVAILRADRAVGGIIMEAKGLIHVDAGRRNGMRMIGHMTRRYKRLAFY